MADEEFRTSRFVSNGDEEFAQDWEIIESEEDSDESEAHQYDSADNRVLRASEHPSLGHGNRAKGQTVADPHSGETSGHSARKALRDVAKQFGIGID
jgi:hypothetical protein